MRHKPEDYVDACYLTSNYMATYSNTVKPVNGMDLWKQSDEPTIIPPQYNRQPGRPRTKRVKDASEKETDGPKLGRVQKSLKCSNCGVLGHNVTTCHMHLPPKTKAPTVSKKRKLNSGEGSSVPTKAKGTKQPPKTKNELREKAKLRAAKLKKKREEKKAGANASGARAATSKSKAAAGTSKVKAAASATGSTRSSVRIRQNVKAGK